MNAIKNIFSIKDLENLSGIKAHTIRIWEKRYAMFEPSRTETNIRYYDLKALQKLLNIALLSEHGYKISRIAAFSQDKIPEMVRSISLHKNKKNHFINDLKMAMIDFDQELFTQTCNLLLKNTSFSDVFSKVFVPFLEEIGLLWQTNTITPAHEHFITFLIKQKLLAETELIHHIKSTKNEKIFILFLPLNEIHEIGLMYLNYEIIKYGHKTVFLGESISIDNLIEIQKYFKKIVYVTYLTVQPENIDLDAYIAQINSSLLEKFDSELWVLGRKIRHLNSDIKYKKINVFNSIDQFIQEL